MPLFYLIRHAESRREPERPAEEWNLTEAGFLAAGALAGRRFWPEIGQLYTSSEPKAIATAAPAAQLWRLPVTSLPELDEVRRGGFVEEYEAQVQRFFEEPEQAHGGWERAVEAQARAASTVQRLVAAHPEAHLALVGHGLLWALLRAHLLGQPRVVLEEWRAIAMPDVAVWRREGERWALLQDFEGIRRLEEGR